MVTVISETIASSLVDISDAIAETESVFVALDRGESLSFPATRGHGSDPGTRFGTKSGFDGPRNLPGVKIGTYWPGNRKLGLASHGSTTLLLDDRTGQLNAIVAATHLTALRTAAADAVAVKYLARADAVVLALLGTGHQAYYNALAVHEVRPLREVLVCGRSEQAAQALAARLVEAGLSAKASNLQHALAQADIISTVTAARAALFPADLVRPGTHVSAMGADGPGKQELPLDLVATASLWAEVPEQSAAMGEFQHAVQAGRIQPSAIASLGAVIDGRKAGRSGDEITIFDSSGVALQDLAICALAAERARASNVAIQIDFD